MSGPGSPIGNIELPPNFAFQSPFQMPAFSNSVPPTSPMPAATPSPEETHPAVGSQAPGGAQTPPQPWADRLQRMEAREDRIDTRFGEGSPQDTRFDARIAKLQSRMPGS